MPSPGDGRVCEACRITVADDSAGRTASAPLAGDANAGFAASVRASSGTRRRTRGGGLRRVVLLAAAVALVIGGAAALATHRQALADEWASLTRHSPAQIWSSIRRRSTEAWLAVRSHLPLGARPAEDPASHAPEAASHRRAQHPAKGKRSREHAVASQ